MFEKEKRKTDLTFLLRENSVFTDFTFRKHKTIKTRMMRIFFRDSFQNKWSCGSM